ncbi:MAG TPA: DUF5074 domain-containing protein [Ferruginibacter sp.]|nr:DUF5074 domain-containing protein [Ferruginibacter sp.]
MKFTKMIFAALISALFLSSCTTDPTVEPTPHVSLGTYDSGVLILNQGRWTYNNSEISFISLNLNAMENNIFSTVNSPKVLGDIGQDIGFYGDFAYIVMNVSNKIEIVNRYTMISTGTITGLNNPRYIAFANGKAYVTNWGVPTVTTDDYIAIIDLSSNTITSTIPVIEGPEKIIENAGKLYVAQYGGYGIGSSISVIDIATGVTSTIVTGELPQTMQIDNGFLWVCCQGNQYGSPQTPGYIIKYNLATNQMVQTYGFSNATIHPAHLTVFGSNGYYTIGSGVYKFALNAPALPTAPVFTSAAENLYGFAIRNTHIYIGDATNAFGTNGKVMVYSLGTAGSSGAIGTLEKTHTVGIGPAGFYFNQ